MSDGIFSKKALKKVRGPEDLNDYIRVAHPMGWIILVAVVILLVGALIWGILGKLYVTVSVPTYVNNQKGISLVSESKINSINEGMPITVDNKNGYIEEKGYKKFKMADISRMYGIKDIEGEPYDEAYVVSSNVPVDNGTYKAEIAIQEIRPISFLFN